MHQCTPHVLDSISTGQQPESQAETTMCCIVGGGPAGAILALLLARQGIAVTLLEAHYDFERAFRGDTLHASVMEILDAIGLADPLLALQHAKVRQVVVPTEGGALRVNLFGRLRTKFPYITVIAQSRFLDFITQQAQQYPSFRLIMGAHVDALLQTDGVVNGVRYRAHAGLHELRATLTIGADGRFSTVRKLAGLTPIQTSSPIDVLWFRLSRRPTDPDEALVARVGQGLFVVCIDRFEYWQVGCVIPKGGYRDLRRAGLDHLRQSLARVAPEWADRLDEIQSWQEIAVLSVEASRLRRWYRPGLLLIGDAAHVMSPVGGVGINYAIQDAVVAANLLSAKLQQRLPIEERDLAQVQRQRELPIRFIQFVQARAQNAVFAQILNGPRDRVFAVPRFVRPLLRASGLLAVPARLLSFGLCPPQVLVGHD